MTTQGASPFYQKFCFNLISLLIIGFILYIGRTILIPLFFAILLATLLLPVTNFLQRKGVHKVIAILLCLIFAFTFIGVIIYFLSVQVGNFFDDLPALREKLNKLFATAHKWVQENFNVTIRAQKEYLDQTAEQMKTTGPAIFERTVLTVTDVLAYIVFVPVYTFLMLYYKDLIKHFIVQVFKNDDENKVREVLQESQSISQQYLTGLLIELAIVFGLNATGFLILGIKYAIFLALVAALLNMVPYIGMLVANIFCMVVTLISSDSVSSVVWVGVTLAAVQIIDNNILLPLIVGSRVQINALVTIIGVLTGGALCGVAGMFLSIPGIAVLKVICERVEDLKPWGVLMGDNGTKAHNGKRGVRRFFSKSRRTAAARR